MKLFNLPRAGGKSMRMIYASEFQNVPILCMNETHKEHLLYLAHKFNIKIPEPITVKQLLGRGNYRDKFLVDEAIVILQEILKQQYGAEIIGCTMSDEKMEKLQNNI